MRSSVSYLQLVGLAIALFVTAIAGPFCFAQEQPAFDEQNARVLISKLLNSSQDEREHAADELLEIGLPVVPMLKQLVADSDDYDQQLRAKIVLMRIQQQSFDIRVEEFMRERDFDKDFGLKGWRNFRNIVGGHRMSKQLFQEVIMACPQFAENDWPDKTELRLATEKLARDLMIRYRQGADILLGEPVALMYASVLLNGEVAGDVESMTSLLSKTSPFSQAIRGNFYATSLKSLFRAWMRTSRADRTMVLITCMELGISEGKELARQALERPSVDPNAYEFAMATMMMFGDESDLDILKVWMTNKTAMSDPFQADFATPLKPIPTYGNGRFEEVQILYCDMALAAIIKIKKRQVEKFFTRAKLHRYRGYSPESLGLPTEDPSIRQRIIADVQKMLDGTYEEMSPPDVITPVPSPANPND